MVTGSPAAAGGGDTAGNRTAAAAAIASPIRAPPLPRRTIQAATAAFEKTTTNVTPKTPVTEARRTSALSSTWDVPRLAHVNPPSGHMPRIQSIAVHAAATPMAVHTGRSRRMISVAITPNTAIDAAERATRAAHASAPNRKIQYSVAPNIPIPKHKPSTAPRPIVRSRSSTNNGATPTNAIGHAPTGENAREVARPAASAPAHPRPSDGRGRGFTSRAVAAEHLLLIRELAPVLHEEAVPAHELGLLHRDDLRVDRLGAIIAGKVEWNDLFIIVDHLLDRLGGLLLGQQVLDRLHVLESGLGRDRRILEVGRCGLGLVLLLDRELFLLLGEFFDVVWHVRVVPSIRGRSGGCLPGSCASYNGSVPTLGMARHVQKGPKRRPASAAPGRPVVCCLLGPASPPGRRRNPDATQPRVRRSSAGGSKV